MLSPSDKVSLQWHFVRNLPIPHIQTQIHCQVQWLGEASLSSLLTDITMQILPQVTIGAEHRASTTCLFCMRAGCVGWFKILVAQCLAWSSPVARCHSHHYLDCFGHKDSLPLPCISSDPEQTNRQWPGEPSVHWVTPSVTPSPTAWLLWGTALCDQEKLQKTALQHA